MSCVEEEKQSWLVHSYNSDHNGINRCNLIGRYMAACTKTRIFRDEMSDSILGKEIGIRSNCDLRSAKEAKRLSIISNEDESRGNFSKLRRLGIEALGNTNSQCYLEGSGTEIVSSAEATVII